MTSRLKVALLTYALDRPLSGIGRYTLELVRALVRLKDRPQLVLLAAGNVGTLAEASDLQRVSLLACSRLPGLVTLGNVLIPFLARRSRANVVHDPTGVTPLFFGADGARTVVTVHDVFAWSFPGHSTLLDTLIYRRWLPRVLPRVDAVITDSETSRADIVRYLRIAADKVTMIYPGVSPAYGPVSPQQATTVAARYDLAAGYILFVGSVEERKNLRRLLRAYAQLQQRGERRPLVVVGARKWKYSRIMQTVEELDLQQRVIFAGYVPDADLPAIYSAADLFVFPSLYEGFGLPPLEAMACGTPVVCSHAASLPEVVGDAAITVDPYDVQGLAEAMHRVLADSDLRDELRHKGLARAKHFSWEKTARQTIEVYEKVLGVIGTRRTQRTEATEGAEGAEPTVPTETTGAIGPTETTDTTQPAIPPACQRGGSQINTRPKRPAIP